jgi:hypothetical protein
MVAITRFDRECDAARRVAGATDVAEHGDGLATVG